MRRTFLAVLILLCAGRCAAQTLSSIPQGGFRIAGVVLDGKGGGSLAQARVILADSSRRQQIQTGISSEDGRFEFRVPAGKYSLQAARKGYISAAYDAHDQFSSAIVTGVGLDTEHLKLKIDPQAVISGKVLGENGEPVRRANVTLYREFRDSGVARISGAANDTTDDRGSYELASLPPGTYFLAVQGEPWYAIHPFSIIDPQLPTSVDRALDVAYPVTYYSDALEYDEATPIPVRGGDRLSINLNLSPLPSLHLLYHISGKNGGSPTLTKPTFGGQQVVTGMGAAGASRDTVEILGIPPGRYNVQWGESEGRELEPSVVDLDSSSHELVSEGERKTSSLQASLKITGVTELPASLRMILRNGAAFQEVARFDAKGKATFSGVPAGSYEALLISNEAAFAVEATSRDGKVSPGHTVVVSEGASLSYEINAVKGDAVVRGQVVRGDKGFAGAMVVLVPQRPGQHQEYFRRDQSDLDGTFSLPGVIPGTYTIIAIENGWDLDWAKPAVLAAYGKNAQTIVVKSGTMQLKEPVQLRHK